MSSMHVYTRLTTLRQPYRFIEGEDRHNFFATREDAQQLCQTSSLGAAAVHKATLLFGALCPESWKSSHASWLGKQQHVKELCVHS